MEHPYPRKNLLGGLPFAAFAKGGLLFGWGDKSLPGNLKTIAEGTAGESLFVLGVSSGMLWAGGELLSRERRLGWPSLCRVRKGWAVPSGNQRNEYSCNSDIGKSLRLSVSNAQRSSIAIAAISASARLSVRPRFDH